jgi:hypothetical protein
LGDVFANVGMWKIYGKFRVFFFLKIVEHVPIYVEFRFVEDAWIAG